MAAIEAARPEADGGEQGDPRRRSPGAITSPAPGRLLVGDRDGHLGRARIEPAPDDGLCRVDRAEPFEASRKGGAHASGRADPAMLIASQPVAQRHSSRRRAGSGLRHIGSLESEGGVERLGRSCDVVLADDYR